MMITLRKTEKPLHKMTRVELFNAADHYDELTITLNAIGESGAARKTDTMARVFVREWARRNR